jgi:hypothetical protein
MLPQRVRTLMNKNGLKAVNKPIKTPSHPTKSHAVMAYSKGQYKLVRFGQQGVKGSPPRSNESETSRKRRINWKKRHRKNIKRGKLYGAYWSNKVKW